MPPNNLLALFCSRPKPCIFELALTECETFPNDDGCEEGRANCCQDNSGDWSCCFPTCWWRVFRSCLSQRIVEYYEKKQCTPDPTQRADAEHDEWNIQRWTSELQQRMIHQDQQVHLTTKSFTYKSPERPDTEPNSFHVISVSLSLEAQSILHSLFCYIAHHQWNVMLAQLGMGSACCDDYMGGNLHSNHLQDHSRPHPAFALI